MKLHRLMGKTGYTTFGCIWEKGTVSPKSRYECVLDNNEKALLQSRITAYWPDGSVKWTAHTANAEKLSDTITVKAVDDETGAKAAPLDTLCGQTGKNPENTKGIIVTENKENIVIDNGIMTLDIPRCGNCLLSTVKQQGKLVAKDFRPELILSEPVLCDGNPATMDKMFFGKLTEAVIEEQGPLMCIVKFTGTHRDKDNTERMRFIIRMKVFYGLAELKFTHTFIYDGNPEKDYLKGLSVAFDMPLSGELYNRHIKFAGDNGVFHESPVTLVSWRPRVPEGFHRTQMEGGLISPNGREKESMDAIMDAIPFFDTYDFCQDFDNHFAIRKKLKGDHLSYIDSLHGCRAKGGLAVGSENSSVEISIRDFWEKYPSGYNVSGLSEDTVTIRIHLYSPSARPYDFRHYADRGYNQVCYEGYDYKGADPYGIACTNEFNVKFCDGLIPPDDELLAFTSDSATTVLYTGEPEEYHRLRAFGYWSLVRNETPLEQKLEKELEKGFEFYKNEVEQRKWYGMFNYGDFMHTYDEDRHVWRYDVGGYAWDNTELVPTLWLWYYFMRTGRADVFRLAEKLTRHTSEVDVYHIGKYKGMGSRHNVIHWGCPCKEARIAMAGHHRFYYYLTGDRRLEDIFDELKDNEKTFLNRDPLGDFYPKEQMIEKSHARTGPDWSSLCSNWMTQWERFNDSAYRDKILVGTEDIENAPLKLVSGPDFEFNPETLHLRYIGERTTGGTHLQICMGAPSIWMEMADLLEDEEWKKMLADYGRFYFLPEDEKQKESGGILGKRQFTLPMFATGIGAYGAKRLNDEILAERVIKTLLDSQFNKLSPDGFAPETLKDKGNCSQLSEISWISTNHVAQFCLNAIMVMEFLNS